MRLLGLGLVLDGLFVLMGAGGTEILSNNNKDPELVVKILSWTSGDQAGGAVDIKRVMNSDEITASLSLCELLPHCDASDLQQVSDFQVRIKRESKEVEVTPLRFRNSLAEIFTDCANSPNTDFWTERRRQVLQGCGQICDTSKHDVRKCVDCEDLWQNSALDDSFWPPPLAPPSPLRDDFTAGGVPLIRKYLRDRYLGHQVTRYWAEAVIEEKINNILEEYNDHGAYGSQSTRELLRTLRHFDVTGLVVLVIGSESPWVEACILAAGGKHVVTLEYGSFVSDHPQVTPITPSTAVSLRRRGALPLFDAVVTFSSVEHSGLGRYGDKLNPWGDLQTIARAWCLARPGALLFLGVPTGTDAVAWNAHRIYGPIRYPHLHTNWRPLKEIIFGNGTDNETLGEWVQHVDVFAAYPPVQRRPTRSGCRARLLPSDCGRQPECVWTSALLCKDRGGSAQEAPHEDHLEIVRSKWGHDMTKNTRLFQTHTVGHQRTFTVDLRRCLARGVSGSLAMDAVRAFVQNSQVEVVRVMDLASCESQLVPAVLDVVAGSGKRAMVVSSGSVLEWEDNVRHVCDLHAWKWGDTAQRTTTPCSSQKHTATRSPSDIVVVGSGCFDASTSSASEAMQAVSDAWHHLAPHGLLLVAGGGCLPIHGDPHLPWAHCLHNACSPQRLVSLQHLLRWVRVSGDGQTLFTLTSRTGLCDEEPLVLIVKKRGDVSVDAWSREWFDPVPVSFVDKLQRLDTFGEVEFRQLASRCTTRLLDPALCDTPRLSLPGCVVYSFDPEPSLTWERQLVNNSRCEVFVLTANTSLMSTTATEAPPRLHLLPYVWSATGQPHYGQQPPFPRTIRGLMWELGHTHVHVVKLGSPCPLLSDVDEASDVQLGVEQLVLDASTEMVSSPMWLTTLHALSHRGFLPVVGTLEGHSTNRHWRSLARVVHEDWWMRSDTLSLEDFTPG